VQADIYGLDWSDNSAAPEESMAEVTNLNRFRKAQARAQDAKQAKENRVRHGRNKSQKRQTNDETERLAKELDGKKLE
jgi:hypothetical protein